MEGITPIIALLLGAWVAYDLWHALKTGKARGRFGTITRKKRPKRFQWYIIGDVVVLVFCAGVVLWWLADD